MMNRSSRGSAFKHVGGLKPSRNVFDLSYRKNYNCDMGQLIPVLCDEVVPGDHIKVGNQTVVRFQPMIVPIMHEINVHTHYFFVPYRILWPDWEKFISQGQLGGDVPLEYTLPTYDYTNLSSRNLLTLWDYFGFPYVSNPTTGTDEVPMKVMDMPWRAYNRVFNEYYRDENLVDVVGDGVATDNSGNVLPLNNAVLNRAWRKDYFTSSLPFRQKGQPPALPVSLDFNSAQTVYPLGGDYSDIITPSSVLAKQISTLPNVYSLSRLSGVYANTAPSASVLPFTNGVFAQSSVTGSGPLAVVGADPNNNTSGNNGNISGMLSPPFPAAFTGTNQQVFGTSAVDVARLTAPLYTAATFGVSDLRLSFQTQKWLERNARGGTRYTEFLRSHFGVSPSDARLDRPEYIGGTKSPVIVSEVLQTSETTSESSLANYGGHGLSADSNFAGSYNVEEFGLVIGIQSIMPKPMYQQGINRQWTRKYPTDFYFPEFAHLSEQSIDESEIYANFGTQTGGIGDRTIFGYTGQYDEMRVKHDLVCGELRTAAPTSLDYWNLANQYPVPPMLNAAFITCVPRKNIFAVTDDTVPMLIVNVQNLFTAVRPMPVIAEPGLIDHF